MAMAHAHRHTVEIDRRTVIEDALASVRIEGLEPSSDVLSLVNEYAAGSLSLEELVVAFQRLYPMRSGSAIDVRVYSEPPVLRNRLNMQDPLLLSEFEAGATTVRLIQLVFHSR